MSAILDALYRGDRDEADRLLANDPPLDVFEASAAGRVDRVAELLADDPARANAFADDGFFPLGLAAFFHHPEVVALLLRSGADPNAVARNPMKVSALHSAVADGGDDASALALIAAGADPDARQDGGWRPLHAAAMSGMTSTVRALLAAGADPEAANDEGTTAVELARLQGHREIERLLSEPR